MDKRTLGEGDFPAGERLIKELEQRGFDIDAAAWLKDDESEIWRLVISSPVVTRQGTRPVYQGIASIMGDLDDPVLGFRLDDVLVASPDENLIRDLKARVATDGGLYKIRLHNARVYRAVGDTIDNGARVRVRATGQLGTVRARLPTSRGPRYLVFYDVTPEHLRPLDLTPRPPIGQDYATEDLDFMYVVRTGGWPEKPPNVVRPAS